MVSPVSDATSEADRTQIQAIRNEIEKHENAVAEKGRENEQKSKERKEMAASGDRPTGQTQQPQSTTNVSAGGTPPRQPGEASSRRPTAAGHQSRSDIGYGDPPAARSSLQNIEDPYSGNDFEDPDYGNDDYDIGGDQMPLGDFNNSRARPDGAPGSSRMTTTRGAAQRPGSDQPSEPAAGQKRKRLRGDDAPDEEESGEATGRSKKAPRKRKTAYVPYTSCSSCVDLMLTSQQHTRF